MDEKVNVRWHAAALTRFDERIAPTIKGVAWLVGGLLGLALGLLGGLAIASVVGGAP